MISKWRSTKNEDPITKMNAFRNLAVRPFYVVVGKSSYY